MYTHPTSSGNKHIPSGGSAGQILRWSSNGTAVWGADNNTTYSLATTSTNGLLSSTDKTLLSKLGVDTGWVKITQFTLSTEAYSTSGSSMPKVRKIWNIVEIRGAVRTTRDAGYPDSSNVATVAMLPDRKFYPSSTISRLQQGSTAKKLLLQINSEGQIIVGRYGTNTVESMMPKDSWLNIGCVYLTDS